MTSTTHEGADASESTQTANTRIGYPAGVVCLGNIVPPILEEEATLDLVNTGDEDLDNKTFADFDVSDPVVDALEDQGIVRPFPIQVFTLPPVLERHDIIGQVKTGTGKTLGFAISVLEDAIASDEDGYGELPNPGHPQALIILPTRELTKQVATDLRGAAKYLSTRIVDICRGAALEPQIEALECGADIVVGTPDRLIDLLRKGVLYLDGVETVVLDEADEMFDLGFLPDVETLLSRVPFYRHTMLSSATMPGPVVVLARKFTEHPTHIRAQDLEDQNQTVNSAKQVIYRVHAVNKIEVVARILQSGGRDRSVIFCRMKRTAVHLGEDLPARGFAVGSLHGDLGQGVRRQAPWAPRRGEVDVFVATDITARSIDVGDAIHVINYQYPEDEKIYIHRIGCIGCAGNSGTAVIFVDWDDTLCWSLISKALGLEVPEPLETYHTSVHLLADLDIPEDTTGRLPRAKRIIAGLSAEKLEDLGGPSSRPRGRRSGDRGVIAGRGSHRHHCGERNHKAKDGDHETRAGRHGRSNRGTRGRGRGNHSQAGVKAAPQVPHKRIRRRKP